MVAGVSTGPTAGVARLPTALLGGPLRVLLAGDKPSLGPLLPVVLPFMEDPDVVELAAGPPAAELPPAVEPAPVPGVCATAAVPMIAKANVSAVNFMISSL